MPEGPEVRRYADELHATLAGHRIVSLTTRMKTARAFLAENGDVFVGKQVLAVRSRGKNLVGTVEGGLYFYAHLLMWGRWQVTFQMSPWEVDRRERARITTENGASAVLLSAPVFELGETPGDPFQEHPYLRTLGPDILPYPGDKPFPESCFVERLFAPDHREREIGAVLLDQSVVAGIGNYLRADMLFVCGISPFRPVSTLTEKNVADLCRVIPELADRAYRTHGRTIPDDVRERVAGDRTLVYPNARSDWAMGHWVFRRTNLPCLICGTTIRQRRQATYRMESGEDKERIAYFCPTCQGVE